MVESSAAFVIVVVMFLYAAYWGFNIRGSLAVRLYRNQALGVVLVASAFALFAFVAGVATTTTESGNGGTATQIVAYAIVTTSIMYFVDSSVLAARRLDPLVRDVFGWTRLRYLLWPLMYGFAIATLALGALGPNPPPALAILGIAPALVPSISGIAALSVSRARTADLAFRRHLSWFGLFGVFFLLFILIIGITPTFDISSGLDLWQTAEYFAPFPPAFVAGYCLYRAAKSLAPLGRLSLEKA